MPYRKRLQAYERWAPIYPPIAHNPLMRVEQPAMFEAWPDVAGSHGCSISRVAAAVIPASLLESGAAQVMSLDFCMPMLRQVPGSHRSARA